MLAHSDTAYWLGPAILALILLMAARAYAAGRRRRPKIRQDEIVFQEHYATGASQRNFITKYCGARNCLSLVVTKDLLWITSSFPAAAFTALFDLEAVIPLRSIMSVQAKRFLGATYLLITYTDSHGVRRGVKLSSKNREAFLGALGRTVDRPVG